MSKSTPRYGIRNRLASDRESWHQSSEYYFETDQSISNLSDLQFSIGRFLLSKREARAPDVEGHPIVQTANNFKSMNRHRGEATLPSDIMLQYQSPEQISERIALTTTSKKVRHLTENGIRDHAFDLKRKMADAFRAQATAEAQQLEHQMRLEDYTKREESRLTMERLALERNNPHLAYDEDELAEIIVELDSEGANALNGPTKNGFMFSSRTFYNGLQIGIKVRTGDDETAAQLQHDVDRINQVYDRFGMIGGSLREVRVDELSLVVPVFTAHTQELSEEIYTPYIPQTRIAFHELGIHKIQ